MTPTVVAFDLSLSSTGVADRNGTRLIKSKKTGPARLLEIRDAVIWACYPHLLKADLVVLEGYSYGSPNQAHPVGELGGVIRVALYERGIRYEVVPPATIKMFACGKGNAKKGDVLLAAVRRLGYEGNSSDESDALWLYALAMHTLGSPIVTLPASHLRALSTVKWKPCSGAITE